MSFSVIASGGAQSTNSGSSVTTSALNCTGADLLIVAASYAHDGVVSDSNGNTYTQVLSEGGAGPSSSRSSVTLWASTSPTVGAGMTFSFTSNSFPSRPTFPGIGVLAVSGSSGAGADQTNGADTFPSAVNSTVPGSITPTQADELWVSVLCQQSSGNAPSANLGTVVFNSAPTSQAEGFGMVYGVQTSATAVNVTWSWTGSTAVAQSGVASFFASSVPPVSASCEGIVQTAGAISAVALGAACVGTAHCAGSAIGTLSGSAVGKVTCAGSAAGVIQVSAVGVVHCSGSCVSAAGSTAAGVVHCSGSATGTLEASCVGVVHCSGSIPHANVSASCQGRVSCSGSCTGTLKASCVGIVHCSGSCSATTGVSCVGVVHCSGFASGTLEASCVGLVHCSGSCHATLEASCIGTVHCSGSCHGTLSVSCVGVVHCSGSIGQGISASCVGVVHCSGSCTALTPRIALVGQVVCSGSIAAHLSVTAVGRVQCGGSISVTASISTNCQGVVHCHGYALGTFHVKCAGIVHCYGWCVIGLAGSPMGCLEANPPWMPPAPVKPANYVY